MTKFLGIVTDSVNNYVYMQFLFSTSAQYIVYYVTVLQTIRTINLQTSIADEKRTMNNGIQNLGCFIGYKITTMKYTQCFIVQTSPVLNVHVSRFKWN